MRTLAVRLAEAEQRLAREHQPVTARIAGHLLGLPALRDEADLVVVLAAPKKDVASLLGTTPEAFSRGLRRLADEADVEAPSTVGVGAAGFVAADRSTVVFAPHLSWRNEPLREALGKRVDLPISIDNDANAALWAEHRFGAARGATHAVMITLGTGIGGAMIHDGVLVPNFEVGSLELDGVMAESRASAKARERDQLSWAEYAERLQRFFSHVERILSPDLFIVGGGISKRPDDYLPLLSLRTPIVPAQLQNNAGIVGAALAAHGSLADGN